MSCIIVPLVARDAVTRLPKGHWVPNWPRTDCGICNGTKEREVLLTSMADGLGMLGETDKPSHLMQNFNQEMKLEEEEAGIWRTATRK